MSRRSRTHGDLGASSEVALLETMFPTATDGQGRRRKRRWKAVAPLAAAAALIGIAVAALAAPAVGGSAIAVREASNWFEALPSDDLPLNLALPRRSVMLAADGKTLVAQLYDENRLPVRLKDVPAVVVNAVLAIEDDRFYERGPIDIRGTVRAIVNNARGRSTQGGSTLTQQYVKNLLLAAAQTPEEQRAATADTLDRKVREARYAVEAERRLGKDGVLEAYLNTAYFGRGAYGIAAAAQRWFGIPLARLNAGQAAVLAALLKSPSNYDPINFPERSRNRRDVVLTRMLDTGRLIRADYDRYIDTDLVVRLTPAANGCGASRWPFFCQAALDSLDDEPVLGATPEARSAVLSAGGLRIVTTLDPAALDKAQRAVDRALTSSNRVATAIAVVEPGTGHVISLATNRRWGSTGPGRTEIVLPTRRAFQPGSTFKPITLATALGIGFSPYTRFDTPNGYVPANLNYPDGGFNNDDRRGHGVIDAYEATAESVNTYFVQVIERTGVKPVAAVAREMGMTGLPTQGRGAPGKRDAALTLGAFETSPLEVASVYATLGARGTACRPLFVTAISRVSTTGAVSSTRKPDAGCHRVLDPAVADTVVDVLKGVFSSRGTGRGLELPGREAFGKTGTTNNSGATWFAGGTPQLASAVWVGDPRGPTYSLDGTRAYGQVFPTVFGRTIAGPIWQEAMTALLDGKDAIPLPRNDIPGLLSLSPVVVPDVRGTLLPAALDALTSAGLTATLAKSTAPADPRFTPGQVVSSEPGPGQAIPAGGTVELTLSDGSDLTVRTR